ncbi:MAG: hypothetical protein MI919_26620, partial [Holophagales bacterium]|nr:hypothetical protein [Holophagales bacterium]
MSRSSAPGADRNRTRALGGLLGAAFALGCGSGVDRQAEGGAAGQGHTVATLPEAIRGVVVRGHAELSIEDGRILPTALAPRMLGLCWDVDPRLDTSRWRVRLTFSGRPAGTEASPASAQAGTVHCFDAEPPPELFTDLGGSRPASGTSGGEPREGAPEETSSAAFDFEICGRLVDDFDGSTWDLPCAPARYRPDQERYGELEEQRRDWLRRAWNQPLERFLPELDALRQTAEESGFRQFAVHLETLAAHFLVREGTPQALAEAERRMASLPSWLGADAASSMGALAAYQHASVARESGRLAEAWQLLSRAESRSRRIAKPRLSVLLLMAQMQAEAGAASEARGRLDE